MYTDAHLHLYDLAGALKAKPALSADSVVCSSSWRPEEFAWTEAYAGEFPGQVVLSFGVHPQEPSEDGIGFLEGLIADKRIAAVGECGFDLYNADFRANLDRQRVVWDIQLDLACRAGLPLIVHCRKAMHLVFADSNRLKRLPSVIFHGWPGSATEAQSLLKRGINAWYSLGKGLLRGDRSLADTARRLPEERLLTETDSPWMTLRGESFSVPADIQPVLAYVAGLRGMELVECADRIGRNFRAAFSGSPVSRQVLHGPAQTSDECPLPATLPPVIPRP